MLTLRPEQMQKFSEAAVKRFEDRMVEHLSKFFPERSGEMGEDAVRASIRYGIGRAKSYGIVSKRDVCKYIDLMFGLGPDFDHDLPWAQHILSESSPTSPTAKINCICAEVAAGIS